jgi:peptidoglycan/xylan/chitin deacetylase (PgdA/CDA1 family)
MGTAHADQAAWSDAEERIRAEIRRLDDIVEDLRAGTGNLHWQGPGAGRFRWRTDRRVRELHDQRATLVLLLSLCGRAGTAAAVQARVRRSC